MQPIDLDEMFEEYDALLKSFCAELEDIRDQDRAKYLKTLGAGDSVPPDDGRLTHDGYERYNVLFSKTIREGASIAESYTKAVMRWETEPPSDEAARTLQVAFMRPIGDIKADELQGLFDRFGDNHQCRRVLVELARKHGITVRDTIDDDLVAVVAYADKTFATQLSFAGEPRNPVNGKRVSGYETARTILNWACHGMNQMGQPITDIRAYV